MTGRGLTIAAVAASVCLGGCSHAIPGTQRSLGATDYSLAFATAREVISQYFSVASADPYAGKIQCRPKMIKARWDRLLGGSPARRVATMRLRRDGRQVVAHLQVAVQRQGSSVYRQRGPESESYDSVPNRSPAYQEAATTAEQNEAWRVSQYDHVLERKILNELFTRLNPRAPPKSGKK